MKVKEESQEAITMPIERAKELTAGCVRTSMSVLGLNADDPDDDKPEYVPLPKASLEELLIANRLMASHSEQLEDGKQQRYFTVADRGIALFYAYENFWRSPHAMLEALGYEISDEDEC